MEHAHLLALLGGVLLGAAASLLWLALGRVAGVSHVLGTALRAGTSADGQPAGWRVAFLGGLLAAGLVGGLVAPQALGATPVALPLVAVAGLVAGVGARVANGCTSGHGVCGISRGSRRSLVATAVFMSTGVLPVAVVRAAGGWS